MATQFRDLPAHAYPFTIEWFKISDLQGSCAIHRIEVTGPGFLTVPSLRKEFGPVWVRVTFAAGKTTEHWPEDHPRPCVSPGQ